MNRITRKLQTDEKLLSIYFTAGFPELDDTAGIIRELEASGADLLEIGLPFSDPLADGPTIQNSSEIALKNGMKTELLFRQLEPIRKSVDIPLLIMGYFNPILQYGVDSFCKRCQEVGIDGLIIPDLPVEEYSQHYREIFSNYGLLPIFLISPQTSDERIRAIDSISEGFIYVVSSAGVTGSTTGFGEKQQHYFKRLSDMKLRSPLIVGFGIKDRESFAAATRHTSGGIIGSAFIKHLKDKGTKGISSFIREIQ